MTRRPGERSHRFPAAGGPAATESRPRAGRIAILADAHLGGPGGPAEPLVEQLVTLPDAGCQRLVLLGDLCQAWVGLRQYETSEVAALVPVFVELRRRGVRLDYVEGNRDFFLAGGDYARLFDFVGNEVSLEIAGRRYLAVHGDGIDERDWQYRFWRRLSKSPPARFLMRRLPSRWARRLVDRTERRLAETNFRHKAQIPFRAIRRYGERRLAEGHDVLLLGHFHEPHRLPVPGGEIRLLDAWFRSRRLEWLPEEGQAG